MASGGEKSDSDEDSSTYDEDDFGFTYEDEDDLSTATKLQELEYGLPPLDDGLSTSTSSKLQGKVSESIGETRTSTESRETPLLQRTPVIKSTPGSMLLVKKILVNEYSMKEMDAEAAVESQGCDIGLCLQWIARNQFNFALLEEKSKDFEYASGMISQRDMKQWIVERLTSTYNIINDLAKAAVLNKGCKSIRECRNYASRIDSVNTPLVESAAAYDKEIEEDEPSGEHAEYLQELMMELCLIPRESLKIRSTSMHALGTSMSMHLVKTMLVSKHKVNEKAAEAAIESQGCDVELCLRWIERNQFDSAVLEEKSKEFEYASGKNKRSVQSSKYKGELLADLCHFLEKGENEPSTQLSEYLQELMADLQHIRIKDCPWRSFGIPEAIFSHIPFSWESGFETMFHWFLRHQYDPVDSWARISGYDVMLDFMPRRLARAAIDACSQEFETGINLDHCRDWAKKKYTYLQRITHKELSVINQVVEALDQLLGSGPPLSASKKNTLSKQADEPDLRKAVGKFYESVSMNVQRMESKLDDYYIDSDNWTTILSMAAIQASPADISACLNWIKENADNAENIIHLHLLHTGDQDPHAAPSKPDEDDFVQVSALKVQKKQTVGPSGGEIRLQECSVTFPEGALREEKEFSVSLDNDPKKFPKFGIPITSILGCRPSMIFDKPVTVKMTTCASAVGNAEILGSLYQRETENSEWVEKSKVVLTNKNQVQFDVRHFSDDIVGLSDEAGSQVDYHLINDVYIKKDAGTIASILFVDQGAHDVATEDMRKRGVVPMLMKPKEIITKMGAEITVGMEFKQPNGTRATSCNSTDITVTPEFIKKRGHEIYFDLDNLPQGYEGLISLRYSLKIDGVEEKLPISTTWPIVIPPENPVLQIQNASIDQHTEVRGNVVAMQGSTANVQNHGTSPP